MKSELVAIRDLGVLQSLVGERDRNLALIEEELDVRIVRSSDGLMIQGHESEVALAGDLLQQCKHLIEKGEEVYPEDIQRALKAMAADRRIKLEEFYAQQIRIAGRRGSIVPKTSNQKQYLDAIEKNDLVFAVGPAGTGKTYLGMAKAVSALLKKEVKRVILCRPAVEAGEKLGFLPGDLAEKVNPYLRPLYDALHDMVDYERAHEMVEKGLIEVAPLAFMRGRTLSDAFVILDEAQNTSQGQMKMFLTRLGCNSKCVVTGDITQIDLPHGIGSGLVEAVRLLQAVEGIAMVHFTDKDVIRHQLVGRIIDAYSRKDSAV